jgi:hypothetical protein
MANEPILSKEITSEFVNLSLPVNGSASGILSEAYLKNRNKSEPVNVHLSLI